MHPAPQTASAPRRRVWTWVLLGAGICLTPFLLLGIVAVSYLTLDSDVRALRQHVMDATDARWETKAQVSVGRLTLGAVEQGLRFAQFKNKDKELAEARLALGAVKSASVGVYERVSRGNRLSHEEFLGKTDRAMQKRGWSRLVGVVDGKQAVLVYVLQDMEEDEPIELCVAVVEDKQLVVASTTVDPEVLGEIVAHHTSKDMKGHLRFAKLKL